MATKNLASDIARRLAESGVKIISLPGGFVQLLGKYGSIVLTHDLTVLKAKELEQICGCVAVQ